MCGRDFGSLFGMSNRMVIVEAELETSTAGQRDGSGRLEAVRRAAKTWTGQLVDRVKRLADALTKIANQECADGVSAGQATFRGLSGG